MISRPVYPVFTSCLPLVYHGQKPQVIDNQCLVASCLPVYQFSGNYPFSRIGINTITRADCFARMTGRFFLLKIGKQGKQGKQTKYIPLFFNDLWLVYQKQGFGKHGKRLFSGNDFREKANQGKGKPPGPFHAPLAFSGTGFSLLHFLLAPLWETFKDSSP